MELGALAIVFFTCSILAFALSFGTYRVLLRGNAGNTNPLTWSIVDRCLIMLLVYLLFFGTTGFMAGTRGLIGVGHVPWVNFNFWNDYVFVYLALGILCLALWAAALRLRRRSPDNSIVMYSTVLYTAIVTGCICYAFGPLTDPKGFLIGMGQGILSIILFGSAVSIPWVTIYCIVIVALMFAVWLKFMPYGPFYVQPQSADGQIAGLYWISTLALELAIFLLILFLVTYIVSRWQDREAKLKEMGTVLKKMFGRYLSTEVMNSLIENPSALELGGENRRVTIMMTDLRGFTAISEQLPPERVVQMLNSYFEIMVDIVLRYNGTINEFIGDALLVVFGAPQEMPDRAEKAIACSIEMQNAMTAVNRENRSLGLPELEMGIGLNEAVVTVGNIGSSKRSKYTVIGSGVNMASRIESYTVGGQILVSESVFEKARDILKIDNKMVVRPKGAEKDLAIYEVSGIGGSYNLALIDTGMALTTLVKEIPVQYTALAGKHAGESDKSGAIIRLSNRACDLRLAELVESSANLKLNIRSANSEIASSHFYAKVVKGEINEAGIVRVSFTALPPRINGYFHAVLDQIER